MSPDSSIKPTIHSRMEATSWLHRILALARQGTSMPFQLGLYRAADGLGPPHTWDREHRQPLGTKSQLRTALDQLLPGLRWKDWGQLLFASGPYAGEDHALELSLFGAPAEILLEFRVYSFPPPIRVIMSGLNLNYCYAQASGEIHYPFAAGDRWPVVAAR